MGESKFKQCVHCGKPASIYVSYLSGKQCTAIAFCTAHAAQQGVLHPQGYDLLGKTKPTLYTPVDYCPRCKMTRKDFERSGRMGCSHCYTVFSPILRPMLKRYHLGDRHQGKVPQRVENLKRLAERIIALNKRLRAAVGEQSFEEAARLRDEIDCLRARARKRATPARVSSGVK